MNFKVKDHYFKKAKKENYLARSVYKLEEINKKYKVLGKNNIVLDLGYYPGSWLQYTSKVVGENGRIVGLDLQEINDKLKNLSNVQLYQMDFFDLRKNKKIIQKFDVILSDMAPKTTGIKTVDQLGSLNLIEEIFDLLPKHLKNNGNLVVKVFDSQDAQNFLKKQKKKFAEFHFLKPKSTRSVSKEFFVIGKGFKIE